MLACRMVHDTDIVELELKSKKFSLSVKKKEALARAEPVYQMVNAVLSLNWDSSSDMSSVHPAVCLAKEVLHEVVSGKTGGRGWQNFHRCGCLKCQQHACFAFHPGLHACTA